MGWNDKLFDNLDQIYWTPKMIGLSTVRAALSPDGQHYLVPKELLSGGRSLYRRGSTGAVWKSGLSGSEELLNQLLEVALAIAPGRFLEEAFFAPLGISPVGCIRTIGREVLARHARYSANQFTQHDGFYISENSTVMMEMKLGARTSVEQYLKYVMLTALEEMTHGPRPHAGLVYLVPQSAVAGVRKDLYLDDPEARAAILSDPQAHTKKARLRDLLGRYPEAFRSVARRMGVAITTWDAFYDLAVRYRDDARATGNETLENLMQGIIAQLEATPACGLGASHTLFAKSERTSDSA